MVSRVRALTSPSYTLPAGGSQPRRSQEDAEGMVEGRKLQELAADGSRPARSCGGQSKGATAMLLLLLLLRPRPALAAYPMLPLRTSLSMASSFPLRRSLSSSPGLRQVLDVPLWIDGRNVASSSTFTVQHPQTGEPVSRVSTCTSSELEQTLASSWAASRTWRSMPANERRKVLQRVGTLLAERSVELQAAYTRETSVGPLIRAVDMQFVEGHVAEAAALCSQVKGDVPSTADGSLALVLREPYGPVRTLPRAISRIARS